MSLFNISILRKPNHEKEDVLNKKNIRDCHMKGGRVDFK